MCQAVEFAGERLFNLNDLLRTHLIADEHVPSDPELARDGIDVHEVCFCAVDVEEILTDAGVPFTMDELGDLHVAEPAAEREPAVSVAGDSLVSDVGPSPYDVWEALGRWWRRRRATRPRLA